MSSLFCRGLFLCRDFSHWHFHHFIYPRDLDDAINSSACQKKNKGGKAFVAGLRGTFRRRGGSDFASTSRRLRRNEGGRRNRVQRSARKETTQKSPRNGSHHHESIRTQGTLQEEQQSKVRACDPRVSFSLSVRLPVSRYISPCLSLCLSFYQSIFLSVSLPVCQFVC